MDNAKVIKAIEAALPYLGKTSTDGRLLAAAIAELRLKPTLEQEFPTNFYRGETTKEDVRNALVLGMTGELLRGAALDNEMETSPLLKKLEKIAQDTTNEMWSVTMRKEYATPGDFKRSITVDIIDAMTSGILAYLENPARKKRKT